MAATSESMVAPRKFVRVWRNRVAVTFTSPARPWAASDRCHSTANRTAATSATAKATHGANHGGRRVGRRPDAGGPASGTDFSAGTGCNCGFTLPSPHLGAGSEECARLRHWSDAPPVLRNARAAREDVRRAPRRDVRTPRRLLGRQDVDSEPSHVVEPERDGLPHGLGG